MNSILYSILLVDFSPLKPDFGLLFWSSVFFLLLGTMTFLYGCKTWERNWDWKNDITLFLKDVETVPNSVLVLGNAGARYIDLSDTKNFVAKREESLEKGIKYLILSPLNVIFV